MLSNLSFKKLFLIDGIGAMFTALLLGQVLARFESVFGMPKHILYVLAGIAGCFALYSFLCSTLLKENWGPYLRGIAISNTLYCITTLGLVIYLNASLTGLGIAYFIGEIIVVMLLVSIEFRFLNRER